MISTFFIFIRGILMGIADSIPGVSGGTVAMIVGIYERLIGAISSVDTEFLSLLFHGKPMKALKHMDFGFLFVLILGIMVGLGGFSILMTHLLAHHLPVTFAAFMGMIVASVIILFRRIKHKDVLCGVAIAVGTVLAYYITSLPQLAGQDGNLGYIFVCGIIAICAMILPGISGSYILLILGEYAPIIARVKNLAQMKTTPEDLLTLCIFGCGCVIGLLAFSRILKFLLKHHHSLTLSILTGFMLGSIRCLWPFQEQAGKSFRMLSIQDFSSQTQIYVLCAFLSGLVGVLILEQAATFFAGSGESGKIAQKE